MRLRSNVHGHITRCVFYQMEIYTSAPKSCLHAFVPRIYICSDCTALVTLHTNWLSNIPVYAVSLLSFGTHWFLLFVGVYLAGLQLSYSRNKSLTSYRSPTHQGCWKHETWNESTVILSGWLTLYYISCNFVVVH